MVLSKRLTVAVVALIVAATGAVVGATAWANANDKPRDCHEQTGLLDYSHLNIHDATAAGTSAGDSVVYHDEIQDSAGKPQFFADGTALVYTNPADGGLWEYLAIFATMPDGTVHGSATISVGQAALGEEQTIPINGSSGRYLGKTGSWRFRLVERRGPELSVFAGILTICG